MGSITGLTSARMKEVEDNAIVNGEIINDNLILTKNSGEVINAGNVRGPVGPQGAQGPEGQVEEAANDGKGYVRKSNAWHDITLATTVSIQTEKSFASQSLVTGSFNFPVGMFSNRPHLVGATVVKHQSYGGPTGTVTVDITYLESSSIVYRLKSTQTETTTVVVHFTFIDFAHSDPTKKGKWTNTTIAST